MSTTQKLLFGTTKTIIGLLLLCIRVIILLLLVPLWIVSYYTFYPSMFSRFFSRFFLYVIGVYHITIKEFIVKPSSSNTTQILPSYTIVQNKTNALLSFNHSPKDWIISNHTSYLDPFVLSSIFTPIFYSLSSINSNNEPIPIPPWSFIKSEHTSSTTTTTASTLPTSVNGPKALFPERTTSNGKGLLQFDQFVNLIPLNHSDQLTFLCVIKYPSKYFSPISVIGSKWLHFLSILMQIYHNIEISILPLSDYQILRSGLCVTNPHLGQHNTKQILAYIMSLFGKVKPTELSWKDKNEFSEYYLSRQSGAFYSRMKRHSE